MSRCPPAPTGEPCEVTGRPSGGCRPPEADRHSAWSTRWSRPICSRLTSPCLARGRPDNKACFSPLASIDVLINEAQDPHRAAGVFKSGLSCTEGIPPPAPRCCQAGGLQAGAVSREASPPPNAARSGPGNGPRGRPSFRLSAAAPPVPGGFWGLREPRDPTSQLAAFTPTDNLSADEAA